MRQIIVLIVAVPKYSILSITPVINLVLLVENDTEIPAGRDSLHNMPIQRLNLRWL